MSIFQDIPHLLDTQAPTVPTGLTATVISSTQINLSWTTSTDNVGMAGYRIYQGGVQIATSSTNSYSNTGLTPSTTHTYTVAAYYYVAGNVSGRSISASATTQAPPAPSITLTKSVDKPKSSKGDILTYTLNLQNISQTEAKNLTITDNIPQGTEYIQDSATEKGVFNPNQNTINWTIPSLAPNENKELSFQVKVK